MVYDFSSRTARPGKNWLWGLLLALLISACSPPTPDPFFTPTPNQTGTTTAQAIDAGFSQPVPVTAATQTEDPGRMALLTREAKKVATATAQAVPQNSPTPLPTATPAPTNTPHPTGPLTSWGTWGLMPSREGLWAMRPDRSNLTLLTTDPIFHLSVSPTGRMAAYVTHSNPNNFAQENPLGYTLKMITLPEARVFDIVSLDMAGVTMESPYEDLDRAYQAIRVFERGGMDWSPGGLRLAFSSAHEGPAADLYVYTPADGKLERLTQSDFANDPAHVYSLQFSPDGSRIFNARAYHFGSGTGYWMAGAWVTDLRGTSVQVANDQYAGERLIDWPRNDTVLLSSWLDDCGHQNLRMVNANSGETKTLWSYCFEDYIYDRRRGEILLSVPEDMAASQEGSQPGLFLYWTWSSESKKLAEKGFNNLFRGDIYAGWYAFNNGEGLFAVTRDGKINPLFTGPPYDGSSGPRIRPYYHFTGENTWLWTGDGFFATQPGQPPVLISPAQPESFEQAPGRNDLYYFTVNEGGQLRMYSVKRGEWIPTPVDQPVFAGDLYWINR